MRRRERGRFEYGGLSVNYAVFVIGRVSISFDDRSADASLMLSVFCSRTADFARRLLRSYMGAMVHMVAVVIIQVRASLLAIS
jgi:hypothetical protein